MAEDICLQILEVLEEFGLDQAPSEVIENLLQGQETSDFDKEQLNVVTKSVSLGTCKRLTKLLQQITRFAFPVHVIFFLKRTAF
jgi:RNase adaptor protein for sRNA GlmZ degradation